MSAIKSTSLRVLRAKPFSNNNARIFNTAERSVGMAATTRTTPSHPSTNLRYPTPVQYYAPQPNAITKTTTNPNPPTSQNAFQQLQNILSSHLASHPASALSPTLPALFSLLRSYTSDAMDWSKFAHANASKQYTRNLVCEVPGLFNLLLLVWTPGKRSPVHDHADSHCLMKILKGNLIETRFAIPTNPGLDGPLLQTSRKNFARDQVTYMSDSLGLHEISNPSPTEYAVSLHLYTPPNAAIRGCHVYDKLDGDAKHVMQGAYDSVRGVVSK